MTKLLPQDYSVLLKEIKERVRSAQYQALGEFPGIQGFSARNIWRMRDFYLAYQGNQKLTPLVAEIGWTHNLVILEKCKGDLEREFYIRMTRKYGWSIPFLLQKSVCLIVGFFYETRLRDYPFNRKGDLWIRKLLFVSTPALKT